VFDVPDGLSNTLAVGELSMADCHGIAGPCYLAWSAQPAGKGTTRSPQPPSGGVSASFGFSSSHPQVVQFAYLDGSVRTVRMFGAFFSATGAPPPYFNLLRLSGKADGEVTDPALD
jgi:hypothetical protein